MRSSSSPRQAPTGGASSALVVETQFASRLPDTVISGACIGASSSRKMRADEISTLKLESQKLQARAFEGSTQPHCEHVFVTGAFCAADASTPVRSDIWRIAPQKKKQAENARTKTRIRHHFSLFSCGHCSRANWVCECHMVRPQKKKRRQDAGATRKVGGGR